MALPLYYNVRNLRVRWQVTLLSVFGIALVVAVFTVLMSMSEGFRLAFRETGREDNAIVIQRGSASELTSAVPLSQRNMIVVDERVARDLGHVRSYLLKDGRLFLSLMADGGIYEWQPATPATEDSR